MPSDMATIKDISIKKGDVVKIKWKPLEQIIKFYKNENWTPSSFLEESSIDYHLSAILNDGHYRVESVYSGGDSRKVPGTDAERNKLNDQRPDEVSIYNHNHEDGDYFRFNHHYIEEISIEHDAANTYFSSKFNLSLMKIDGALFINGDLVTKNDGKLIEILESTISDLAIQKMLEGTDDMDY